MNNLKTTILRNITLSFLLLIYTKEIYSYSIINLEYNCTAYNLLTPMQKGRLLFSYHQGREYNLGYTLASIALTESSAGVFRLNMISKDIGLYQVNYKTAYRTLGVTNYYKRQELAEKLIYNDILNSYIALSVLKYYYKYYKGSWRDMVQGYNAGHRINTKNSLRYLANITNNVKILEKCMVTY